MQIFNQALVITMTMGIFAGLGSGCGGDSDSSNAADTGLPPTQLLSDVTPADRAAKIIVSKRLFENRVGRRTKSRNRCYKKRIASVQRIVSQKLINISVKIVRTLPSNNVNYPAAVSAKFGCII